MIRSFFKFTKRERKASLYFLFFLLGLIAVKQWFATEQGTFLSPVTVNSVTKADQQVAKVVLESEHSSIRQKNIISKKVSVPDKVIITAQYDPNRMELSDWMSFGFSDKQSQVIFKYIKSQGGLVEAKQLNNIYAVSEKDKAKMVKWCKISKLDINQMTAKDFSSYKGVGEVLSKRILKYRSLLGGFYSLQQLYEVYGLDSVVVDQMVNRSQLLSRVQKIKINSWPKSKLKKHPYINEQEARSIIGLRSVNKIEQESQLFDVFSDSIKVLKLTPYISYE